MLRVRLALLGFSSRSERPDDQRELHKPEAVLGLPRIRFGTPVAWRLSPQYREQNLVVLESLTNETGVGFGRPFLRLFRLPRCRCLNVRLRLIQVDALFAN